MRPIKFRAWNKRLKEMQDPLSIQEIWQDGINYEGGDVSIFGNTNFVGKETTNIKDFIFMQFTGLIDKQGKEIYEGDIVEMRNPERYTDEEPYKVMIEKQWVGDSSLPAETYGYLFPKNKDGLKVIGNIYENKELLKEQN